MAVGVHWGVMQGWDWPERAAVRPCRATGRAAGESRHSGPVDGTVASRHVECGCGRGLEPHGAGPGTAGRVPGFSRPRWGHPPSHPGPRTLRRSARGRELQRGGQAGPSPHIRRASAAGIQVRERLAGPGRGRVLGRAVWFCPTPARCHTGAVESSPRRTRLDPAASGRGLGCQEHRWRPAVPGRGGARPVPAAGPGMPPPRARVALLS